MRNSLCCRGVVSAELHWRGVENAQTMVAVNDSARHYLRSSLRMLDYGHFRRRGYPIGSGCVESGHKVVVQRRLKGAGMRWAEHHLDPMLTRRGLVCNTRWQQIVLFHQEQ